MLSFRITLDLILGLIQKTKWRWTAGVQQHSQSDIASDAEVFTEHQTELQLHAEVNVNSKSLQTYPMHLDRSIRFISSV